MRWFTAFVFALALGGAAACGGDDGGDEAASDGPTSTVPVQIMAVDGHDHEMRTITVDDTEREYWLFRPTTLDPATPAPLVVDLHGIQGSASTMSPLGFSNVAEREGIVVAYPNAVDGVWDLEGTTDVAFVDALVDEVSASIAIDAERVYAIGYSMGGEMATFLTCHLPGEITAVASVAIFDQRGPQACPTPSPARVLGILGELDRIYSIDDGVTDDDGFVDPPGPLAEEVDAWATTNGCSLDYEEQAVEEGVVRREYPCESGALVLYIHPGGHSWDMGTQDGLDTNEVIWEYLLQYTEPIDPG